MLVLQVNDPTIGLGYWAIIYLTITFENNMGGIGIILIFYSTFSNLIVQLCRTGDMARSIKCIWVVQSNVIATNFLHQTTEEKQWLM